MRTLEETRGFFVGEDGTVNYVIRKKKQKFTTKKLTNHLKENFFDKYIFVLLYLIVSNGVILLALKEIFF